jgi:hypothetical protein
MRSFYLTVITAACGTILSAQTTDNAATLLPIEDYRKAVMVDFGDYLVLAEKAQKHREDRLVSFADFQQMASEPNTIILDTRSDSMYMAKHLKGAIHLNFSDFNVASLQKIIPSPDTRILIYCNNNFSGDNHFFASKMAPPKIDLMGSVSGYGPTMALNIPTFINLYGYGYTNVYELGEEIQLVDFRTEPGMFSSGDAEIFEGTQIPGSALRKSVADTQLKD